MFIPFNKPVMPSNFDDILSKTIQDGWLTTGPVVNVFEHKLKEYLNCDNVVAVNSCTAALHLALAAFKYDSGDKFIAPSYTFVATVEAGEYLPWPALSKNGLLLSFSNLLNSSDDKPLAISLIGNDGELM